MNKKKRRLIIGALAAVGLIAIVLLVVAIARPNHPPSHGKSVSVSRHSETKGDALKEHKELTKATDTNASGDDKSGSTGNSNSNDGASGGKIVLTNEQMLKEATVEGSNPTLLAATDRYLLIQSYGGVLYLYDLKTKERIMIDKNTDIAALDPKNEMVIYTKDGDHTPSMMYTVYAYDINLKSSVGEVDRSFPKIAGLSYTKGAVIYTAYVLQGSHDEEDHGFYLKTKVIGPYKDKYPGQFREKVWEQDMGPAVTVKDGVVYTYTPQQKAFQIIRIGDHIDTLSKVPYNIDANDIQSIDINDRDQWLIRTMTPPEKDSITKVYIPDNVIEMEAIVDAYWFGHDHIIISNNDDLYDYNVATKQSTKIKSDVFEFRLVGNTIYYNDNKDHIVQATVSVQ